MMADKNLKSILANERSEDWLEEKRKKTTDGLEVWDANMCHAERLLRRQENERFINGEIKMNNHMTRNWQLGCVRHNALAEQAQKDVLKRRVQGSLMVQLNEMRQK